MKHEFLPRRILAGFLLFSLISSTAGAASFTVTSLEDTGDGTLRYAITQAEANAEADTIDFSLSGTIVLASPLPTITKADGLTIDGTGQTITINGDNKVQVMNVGDGAQLALESLTLANGFASAGGGISNSGTLTVTHSTFSANHAIHADGGGGVFNSGTLTAAYSAFSGNRAYDTGGGISNSGTLTLTHSTFFGNSAYHGVGGGIVNTGTMAIANSTFFGNRATIVGGGIMNARWGTGTGTGTVTNSTLSGNTAYYGGGIANLGTLTVTNSTLSGNTADYGGGINNGINNGAILTLTNTILANSPTGGDCVNYGTLNAVGVNLVEDGTCGFSPSGDPLLGPLADNGGPTQTMALQPGSPAIDAITDGTCPPPTADQRGVSRPQGLFCDIGAFEVEVPVSCRTTADLRPGGSTDAVRITDQGQAEMPYWVQFVNAQGAVQGKPVSKSLVASQSAVNTIGALMQQAGLKTFNPSHLLQIRTEPTIGVTESWLQSVYTPTNGTPPVMMVYTCEPETSPK